MEPDQGLGDRQPQPPAIIGDQGVFFDAGEGVGYQGQLVGGDAHAVVRDGKDEIAAGGSRGQGDRAALGRELDRIGQKVEQDLLDRPPVGVKIGHRLGDGVDQFHALAASLFGDDSQAIHDDFLDRHGDLRDRHLSRFNG